MSSRTFTPEQTVQIAMAYGQKRVAELAKSLRELRDREQAKLAKAIIPPHKHSTGTTSSAGIEDVAPSKLNPPGKHDAYKGEKSAHPPEETSGEISPDDLKKEELCKKCGNTHDLSKGCDGLDKAILRDTKGKEVDTSEHPKSVVPDDKKSKEVSHDGSGGEIVKKASNIPDHLTSRQATGENSPSEEEKVHYEYAAGPKCECGAKISADDYSAGKSCNSCSVKKASPPMAKPPSGKNMNTHVPTSVTKGVMSDVAMRNSPPVPSATAPAPQVKMPSPAEHAQRRETYAAFTPPASVGHQPKRPGIFGRLNKAEDLAKGTVTQPMPKIKPAGAGMAIAGAPAGNTAMTSMTATAASADKTGVLPKPPGTVAPAVGNVSRNVLGKPTQPPKAPVLTARPALKPAGAKLATAGASRGDTMGDQTVQETTKPATPKANAAAQTKAAAPKAIAGK
jgi:hypothetical protein